MSLKIEFVEKALRPEVRMSVLCRQYGISRETGYKWLNRFKKEGPDGLEELSRRPKSVPLSTAENLVFEVLELRESYPRRGPKKLFVMLQRKHQKQTPSVVTIARILRRFGKVRQRSKFRRLSIVMAAPTIRAKSCNEVWTVDFKGWWKARDGQRCEPLTVRDAFSRFICLLAVEMPSLEETRSVFKRLFTRYGLPTVIQCDNGNPFINVAARGGLTRLSAWWISLGIKVVRSRPGSCPQDNGAHERMHRDMREEIQASPSASRLAEQRACDKWRQEFNHVRPHEALAGKTPGELYRRSERKARVSNYNYPFHWTPRSASAPSGDCARRGSRGSRP